MLFENKDWWKEVGITLFHYVWLSFTVGLIGFIIIGLFFESDLISIYEYDVIERDMVELDYYILITNLSIICSISIAFLIIWRSHKKAIRKNDNKYHLFQSKEWWKEFIIIMLILNVPYGIIYLLVGGPDYIYNIYFEELTYYDYLLSVFSIVLMFLIPGLLHIRAVKNQKKVDYKSKDELK